MDNDPGDYSRLEQTWGIKNKLQVSVVAVATTAIACLIPNMQVSANQTQEFLPVVEVDLSIEDLVSKSSQKDYSPEISISEMVSEMEQKKKEQEMKEKEKKKEEETEYYERASIRSKERWNLRSPAEKEQERENKIKEAKIGKQRMQFAHVKPETDTLALLGEAEADPNDEVALFRVMSVFLNRVRTVYDDFLSVNTVKEVLYQVIDGERQYAPETIRYIESGREPSEKSLRIAEGLINGTIEILPEEVLYQTREEQAWMAGKVKSAGLENPDQFYGIPIDYYEKCR